MGDETTSSTHRQSYSGPRDEVQEELDRDESALEKPGEQVHYKSFGIGWSLWGMDFIDILRGSVLSRSISMIIWPSAIATNLLHCPILRPLDMLL